MNIRSLEVVEGKEEAHDVVKIQTVTATNSGLGPDTHRSGPSVALPLRYLAFISPKSVLTLFTVTHTVGNLRLCTVVGKWQYLRWNDTTEMEAT